MLCDQSARVNESWKKKANYESFLFFPVNAKCSLTCMFYNKNLTIR